MVRLKRFLPFILFCTAFSTGYASVTVAISTVDLTGGITPGAYVRIDLLNCPGATLLNTSQTVTYQRIAQLRNGSATVTLPDNTTQIVCSGVQTSYYAFTLVSNHTETLIRSAVLPPGTFALANLANITTPPFSAGILQGPTGPGFRQRGPWAPNTSYEPGDVVTYGGVGFYSNCTQTSGSTFDPALWNSITTLRGPVTTTTANGANGDFVVTGNLTTNGFTATNATFTNLILGALSSTNTNGASINGFSVNNVVNPLSYGVWSGLSTQTTTATASAGSSTITLGSGIDFAVNQGIFIAHAGAACASADGVPCPTGVTPSAATNGTSGSTTYTYRIKCDDGKGGSGAAGAAYSLSTGNATLSTTNSNTLTWAGQAGCPDVIIYRNNLPVATSGSSYSGANTFIDYGLGTFTARDIPTSPDSTLRADNYVGSITALGSSTASVAPAISSSVSTAIAAHSDVALMQAALNTGASVEIPSLLLINYPLNDNNRLRVNRSGGGLILDTGAIGVDITGSAKTVWRGVHMLGSQTNGYTFSAQSNVGFFCSRHAPSVIAQENDTEDVEIDLTGGVMNPNGGLGRVAYYNYGCEIENHTNLAASATSTNYLTQDNDLNLHSPFDGQMATGLQSMSRINFTNLKGGGEKCIMTMENAYNIGLGYSYWEAFVGTGKATVCFKGQNGAISITDLRTEIRNGGIELYPGAALVASHVFMTPYRTNNAAAQIVFDDASARIQDSEIFISDYGGLPTDVQIFGSNYPGGPTQSCQVSHTSVHAGVHDVMDPAGCAGQNNALASTHDGSHAFSGNVPISGSASVGGTFTWGSPIHVPGAVDLDTLTACGVWDIDGVSVTHAPPFLPGTGYTLQTICSYTARGSVQLAYADTPAAQIQIYSRHQYMGAWSGWYLTNPGYVGYTGTVSVSCPAGSGTLTFSSGSITSKTGAC